MITIRNLIKCYIYFIFNISEWIYIIFYPFQRRVTDGDDDNDNTNDDNNKKDNYFIIL